MYLKKIEAQGFKSFANRGVFEFTPGIMCIVGPNGSGKSNVADAVRWVLGEQSAKQLRGSNMQDVIFSGTENRRAMGYAYVAVTLDNTDHALNVDYDEVTISRQVFRSGESEYRINGNICRLKDVYELFYDTGIGREGYSIIGQGQIDQILSNKPEERREMFDEAAGIVKFKKRKAITLKKLEEEHQNLLRVNDIVSELEKRVGPLEKESETAKHYLNLRDELRAYEIGAFYLESTEAETHLQKVRENLAIVTGDLTNVYKEAETLKDQYDSLSGALAEQEEVIDRKQQRRSDVRVDQENREGRIGILREQIQSAKNSKEMMAERLTALDGDISRLNEEKAVFMKDKGDLNRQLDAADDKITRMEEKLEAADAHIQDLLDQAEAKNSEILASMQEKAELAGNIQSLDAKRSNLQLRRSELAQELLTAEAEEQDQRARADTCRKDLQETKAELEEDAARINEYKESLSGKQKELSEANQILRGAEQKTAQLKSRLEALQNLTERYEGYGGAVRKVMDCRNDHPAICGVVADLITTDKLYETAVETALGGKIQNIVTETEACAKEMVQFLKQNRLGRATFLPLDSVSGQENFPQPEALKENGAIGRGSDLVKADKKYAGVVQSLLGNILVARDMEAGSRIARKYHFRLHIVTLEGEYFSPGGSISGGAFKNSSNLLGRRRELSELEEAVKNAQHACRIAEEKAALLEKDKESLEINLENLRTLSESRRLRETKLSLELAQLERDIEEGRSRRKNSETEEKQILTAISAFDAEKEKAVASDRALDAANVLRRKEITGITASVEREKNRRAAAAKDLEQLRIEFANQNQKNEFLLENIRRINSESERLLSERENVLKTAEESIEAQQAREAEIEALTQAMADGEAELAALGTELETLVRQKEETKEKQQGYFASRELVLQRQTDLDKESFRLQGQQQRLEEQIEKQAEYLWSEYEMTPSQAKAAYNPEITKLSEARSFISEKKAAIKALGNVNVSAIEEFKEVSERFTFLHGQQQDIAKAEEELQKIIRQLEDGMRRQFSEQFAIIQREFNLVFRDLFGGGKGTLELMPGEDPLDAGVIINAQPPGKKLQNMAQLSGGEKSLTAIALLFAIQRLKPSPFCLLDEIEAALDEPNVARFADYLNRLKDTTQFLVITHRRGTMEMADRLYGVTMQEKGISVLVSVTLTDAIQNETMKE